MNTTQTKQFNATQGQKDAANALVIAMAYTQTVRPVIQKIETDILQKFKYKWDLDKVCGNTKTGRPKRDILEFSDKYGEYCHTESMMYLINDKDFGHYLTEKHAAITQAGFKVEYGSCPLLIAEDIERKARRLLIEEMEPVTNISFDQFFNTTKWEENLKKYIDLTLRLLSPFIKNQFKAA